jgi:acetyl-CoA acetyltransferase
MVPFRSPRQASAPYDVLGAAAARAAVEDAGMGYPDIEQAYVSYVYGDSTSGQRALYHLGQTGIPIVNVNNNCSSGSSALYLAWQAVSSGAVDRVLVVGFEQMAPGAIATVFADRSSPLERFEDAVVARYPEAADLPVAIRLFGAAAHDYLSATGTTVDLFAAVRVKASRHAAANAHAIFRSELTAEQVLQSPHLFLELTRLQACPPSTGAAAAVICSPEAARRHGGSAAVGIRAMALGTDDPATFTGDATALVGASMSARVARTAYERAGIGPEDAQLAELHDCFAPAEVIFGEAIGLCGPGESARFVADGDNTYGGRIVVNPSGGLLSKGHPLGATGVAQCVELVTQLRGAAGPRQVPAARVGIQHNVGLGGAAVVGVYATEDRSA